MKRLNETFGQNDYNQKVSRDKTQIKIKRYFVQLIQIKLRFTRKLKLLDTFNTNICRY